MIDLKNLKLSDILPSSISDDPQIKSMAEALDPELQSVSFDTREALIVSRIDELPENVLNLLAWQWHVDFYEPELLPVEMKRSLIKNSIVWHRKKGTLWAVKQILRDLGLEPTIREWYEMDGAKPYTFAIDAVYKGNSIDLLSFLGEDTEKLLHLAVEVTKPVRADLLYLALLPEPPAIAFEHGYGFCFYGKCFYCGGWWPLSEPFLVDAVTLPDPRVLGMGSDLGLSFLSYFLFPAYGTSFYGDRLLFRLRSLGFDTHINFADRRFARCRDWSGRWMRRMWTDREFYWEPSHLCAMWSFSFAQGVYGGSEPMGSDNCVYSPGYWVYPDPPLYGSVLYGDRYPAPYRVRIDKYYSDHIAQQAHVETPRITRTIKDFVPSWIAYYLFPVYGTSYYGEASRFRLCSSHRENVINYADRRFARCRDWSGPWERMKWTDRELYWEPAPLCKMWDFSFAQGVYGGQEPMGSLNCVCSPGYWVYPDPPLYGSACYGDLYPMPYRVPVDRYYDDRFTHYSPLNILMFDCSREILLSSRSFYEDKGWGGPWVGRWGFTDFPSPDIEMDGFLANLIYESKPWDGPWKGSWTMGEIPCVDGGLDESVARLVNEGKSWGGPWEGQWTIGEIPCSGTSSDESLSRLVCEHKPWDGPWEGQWTIGEIPCSGTSSDESLARLVNEGKSWGGPWEGQWTIGEMPCPETSSDESLIRLVYEHKDWGGPWEGSWTIGNIPSLEIGLDDYLERLVCEHKPWGGPWEGQWTIDEMPCPETSSDESLIRLVYEHKDWGGPWEGQWTIGEIPCSGTSSDESVARLVNEGKSWGGPWEGQWTIGEMPCPETSSDESLIRLVYEHKDWGGPWEGQWTNGEIPCPEIGLDESLSRLVCEHKPWDGPWEGLWSVGEIPCAAGGSEIAIKRTSRDDRAWAGAWGGAWTVEYIGQISIIEEEA
jgi:phage tail P2-like protein